MKEINLKDAFGQTPESIGQCVVRSLHMQNRRNVKMKRAVPKTLLAAALIVALLCAAAVASDQMGVLDLFTVNGKTNEAAVGGIQTVESDYTGSAVNVHMQDALFDSKGGTFALSWTVENNHGEDNLYVLCDKVLFGGEGAFERKGINVSEYFLPREGACASMLGELPQNGSTDCEISFTVLRALCPVEEIPETETLEEYEAAVRTVLEKGSIPMDCGYLIPDETHADKTYTEDLLASDKFELADQFTMKFTLQDHLLDDTWKVYSGERQFVFDDYELRIREARMSATSAFIQVEYLTPEAPQEGGKGIGHLWKLHFTAADDTWWHGNAGWTYEDPVLMEDGRYMSVFTFEAVELFFQPDQIKMTLITYDENLANRTMHEEDAVLLSFQ